MIQRKESMELRCIALSKSACSPIFLTMVSLFQLLCFIFTNYEELLPPKTPGGSQFSSYLFFWFITRRQIKVHSPLPCLAEKRRPMGFLFPMDIIIHQGSVDAMQ